MTKPANFPERKNARRKAALKRLKGNEYISGASNRDEAQALVNSIVPSARHVQTKKYRGAR